MLLSFPLNKSILYYKLSEALKIKISRFLFERLKDFISIKTPVMDKINLIREQKENLKKKIIQL